ncbi:sigma factor-like helix-turn-helix DNA-binding protein [Oscillospiraceae bacterium 42-9]
MKYAPRKVYIKVSGGYAELTYKDFCRRRQVDQSYMDKLFIPVQGCLLEVMREQYADFYKEKERWRYLQKLDTNHSLLSLEGFTDSEGNVIDFVVDEAVDVAETVVHAVMVDRLKTAMEKERNELFCKAVARLPEIQRRRFLLYYEYDFNFYQIAEMEHCTASAVQKSVSVAREKVKAEMRKYLQP